MEDFNETSNIKHSSEYVTVIKNTFNRKLFPNDFNIRTWLDRNKYHREQKFVREHFASVLITIIVKVIHVYSINKFLKRIIISGRSCTLYLGFKRYLYFNSFAYSYVSYFSVNLKIYRIVRRS